MLYCDNKTTINIANNPLQHDIIKYVKINRYFIKNKLDKSIVYMPFVGSKEEIVVVFIKDLSITDFFNDGQDDHDKFLCIILRGVEYCITIVKKIGNYVSKLVLETNV
jgi:hypothetical protein